MKIHKDRLIISNLLFYVILHRFYNFLQMIIMNLIRSFYIPDKVPTIKQNKQAKFSFSFFENY